MTQTPSSIALPLLLLAGCAGTAIPEVSFEDNPAGHLRSMVWMAGSWVGESEGNLWEAHYTSSAGGLLLGITKRYTKEGNVDFFEFESFAVEDGKLAVRPYVQGKRSVAFTCTKIDPAARRATFENPEHEPQTLEYWRTDADTLTISVTSPIRGAAPGAPQVRGFRVVLKRL